MTTRVDQPVALVPKQVSLFSPVLKLLLTLGVPLGLNGLITIRGRTSGLPRTTPVAIIAAGGSGFRIATSTAWSIENRLKSLRPITFARRSIVLCWAVLITSSAIWLATA